MPLLELKFAHGRSAEDARARLDTAVQRVNAQFGAMVQRTTWNAERDRVRLEGPGVWVEISVDAQNVYATGDMPLIGALLGAPIVAGLKQLLQQTFQKQLPR